MNGIRNGAYQLYRVLVAAIAAACVVQIFLAGRGAFGVHGSAKLDDQSSFDPHRALGEIIAAAAVLAFVCTLVVWRDRKLIGYALALAVMAEVIQHALALPKHPWVAGLHAVDGVGILALSGWLAHAAWSRSRGQVPETAPSSLAPL
jgi:Mn2+/Fe2+ NRAMP family transporter